MHVCTELSKMLSAPRCEGPVVAVHGENHEEFLHVGQPLEYCSEWMRFPAGIFVRPSMLFRLYCTATLCTTVNTVTTDTKAVAANTTGGTGTAGTTANPTAKPAAGASSTLPTSSRLFRHQFAIEQWDYR